MKLDYYHQKLRVANALKDAERLKTNALQVEVWPSVQSIFKN